MVDEEPEAPAASARPRDRLRTMVDANFDFVWRALRSFGVSATHADDACQQVFLIASKKLGEIVPGSERAFLFGTARGVAANARRVSARSRELNDEDALDNEMDSAPNPEQSLERAEQRKLLGVILDGMQEDNRDVFVLFEIEGLTTPEIAKILTIPTGTVASRLRRAREHFDRETARIQSEREGRR